MSAIKNQHVVPKGYLRAFAKDEFIQVFDNATGKSYPSNIKNVGCENRFYDIPPALLAGTQDPQVVEKALADIDDRFVHCRDAVLAEAMEQYALSSSAKASLLEFLATQWLRTQVIRQGIAGIAESTASVVGLDPALAKQLGDALDGVSFMHARMMFDPVHRRELEAVLSQHVWMLGVNCTDMPFYTSDSPVVEVPHAHDAFGPKRGVASVGIQIVWPLTPRYVLMLFERTHFRQLQEKENKVILLEDAQTQVLRYNQDQVVNSYRQIYSCDGNFETARELLRLNPHLSNVDRPRVEIMNPPRLRPGTNRAEGLASQDG